jgi:hypothetical protein
MRRRPATTLAAAVACAAAVVAAPWAWAGSAAASSGQLLIDVAGDGQGWVHDSSHPLFHFDKVAPVMTTSASFRLKNDSASSGHLSVKAIHVHDDDNGCVRQETAAGDTTCGDGEGELAAAVRFTVVCESLDHGRPLWSGTISDIEKGVTIQQPLAPKGVLELHVAAELPRSAGNETMTDRLAFDLAWTLTTAHSAHTAIVKGQPMNTAGTGLPVAKLAAIPPFVGALGLLAGWRQRSRGRGTHRR